MSITPSFPSGSTALLGASFSRFSRSAKRTELVCSTLILISTYAIADVMAGNTIALTAFFCVAVSIVIVSRSYQLFVFRRITIASFWYLTYLAMIFFPAFWVYSDQVGPYRGRYLFGVESVLITVPLGWQLVNWILGFQKSETELFFRKPLSNQISTGCLLWRYALWFGIALFFTAQYFREVSTIPLFYLFGHPGDYLVLADLREDSLKLLDSPFTYFYYLTRSLIYPFLILVSFGAYLLTRTRKWLWVFLVTFCLGLLFSSLSLAKSPVAAIFAMIGFFLYFYRGGDLSRRAVVILLTCVLLFPVGVVLSVSSGMNVGFPDAVKAIATRLFYLPSEVVYYYFEIFPAHVGYLHGRSINKLAWLLGWQYFDTAAYAGQYGFLDKVASVFANSAFIGDMNADFGLWGVILGGFLAGSIMQMFHIYLVRKRKTILTLACYSFCVFTFWFLNSTSLPVVLASDGAILALLMAFLLEEKRSVLMNHARTSVLRY